MTLTPDDHSNLSSALDAEGFAVVPQLLSPDWIQRLKGEAARFSSSRHPLAVHEQLVHRSAVIREFVETGPQVAMAVLVLGPNVCFTHQQFVTKHPDTHARTDIPWHQDNGYGRLEPPTDLTVWITLDDCDERNGCLWVVPRSDRNGLMPHVNRHGLMAADTDTPDGVALPMQAGDAVVFNSLLLHRSLPNRTDHVRVALYVRYCTPDVIMVSKGDRPVLDDPYSWMVAGEAS